MGVYSLEIKDQKKYHSLAKDILIYNFENYLMKKRFMVGNGIEDEGELDHAILFYDILCDDNCDIINYIQSKINGTLESSPKKKKTKSLEYNEEERTEIVDLRVFWDIKAW